MASVSPSQPYVVNDDGTVSVLVFRGRTFVMTITHKGITNPAGYKFRASFKAAYDDVDPLMEASSEDGSIAVSTLPDSGGTQVVITITDEITAALEAKKGVYDALYETPGGAEYPLIPSSRWTLWPGVTE